jgi:hypothetical protein
MIPVKKKEISRREFGENATTSLPDSLRVSSKVVKKKI